MNVCVVGLKSAMSSEGVELAFTVAGICCCEDDDNNGAGVGVRDGALSLFRLSLHLLNADRIPFLPSLFCSISIVAICDCLCV